MNVLCPACCEAIPVLESEWGTRIGCQHCGSKAVFRIDQSGKVHVVKLHTVHDLVRCPYCWKMSKLPVPLTGKLGICKRCQQWCIPQKLGRIPTFRGCLFTLLGIAIVLVLLGFIVAAFLSRLPLPNRSLK